MERHHSHASDLKAELERTAESETTPPNTVLVRWEDELLLVDAWNVRGNKLRTVPSIIDEAITHFQIRGSVEEYRLAVHELVDEQPALLYLGLSALRFVENGRVLELVKIQHQLQTPAEHKIHSPRYVQSATETWETAPLAAESRHQPSDFSTASSSDDDYHSASTLSDGPPRSAHFMSIKVRRAAKSHENKISQSEPPSRDAGNPGNRPKAGLVDRKADLEGQAHVYVHPRYGPLFRHLQSQSPRLSNLGAHVENASRTQDGDSARVTSQQMQDQASPPGSEAEVTYDFRNRQVLPRPTLSRSTTPLAGFSRGTSTNAASFSPAISRNSSYASDLSRRAGRATRQKNTEDDDLWLSSDSGEKWKNIQLDPRRLDKTPAPHRHRSFERLNNTHFAESSVHSRPLPLPRSQSYTAFTHTRNETHRRAFSRT